MRYDSLRATRKISRVALFSGTAVAGAYLLIAVPNVELLTATIAISGLLLGTKPGALTGVIAMTIYGTINSWGFTYPPMLVSQVIAQGLNGALFGLTAQFLLHQSPLKQRFFFGLFGMLVTLFFDLITNLAFPLSTGVGFSAQLMTYLVAGIPFAIIHTGSNILIFAFLVPVAFKRVKISR